MEVAVAIVVAASAALIFGMRTLLTWGLGSKALRQGARFEISGMNPLAPTVRIEAQDPPHHHRPTVPVGHDETRSDGEVPVAPRTNELARRRSQRSRDSAAIKDLSRRLEIKQPG